MSEIMSRSSYLNYLPPVLWEMSLSSPEMGMSLGDMLKVFEKILTGIQDDKIVGNGRYEPIETTIAKTHIFFNPWTLPPESSATSNDSLRWLKWLASWVALELHEDWDDYQKRKIISEIVQIYQKRGLKQGLYKYFDLYKVSSLRPRITVDDGSKILIVRPKENHLVPATTLVSKGALYRWSAEDQRYRVTREGLVQPQCIALASDGTLVIGDRGIASDISSVQSLDSSIWTLPISGNLEFSNIPKKITNSWPSNFRPRALAIDELSKPWELYILDGEHRKEIRKLTYPDFKDKSPTIAKWNDFGLLDPIDMGFDGEGNLFILDRGSPSLGNPPTKRFPQKIIKINIRKGKQAGKYEYTSHDLITTNQLLSLLVLSNGDLYFGVQQQRKRPGLQTMPGRLFYIRGKDWDKKDWKEEEIRLTQSRENNFLVAPIALEAYDENLLYILDAGLKPYPIENEGEKEFERDIAEPAMIFSLNLKSKVLKPVMEPGSLVFPTGIVSHGNDLYVCDPGSPASYDLSKYKWHILPHLFGVLVHFSRQPGSNQEEREAVLERIRFIVEQEKPAHTAFELVSIRKK